MLESLRGHARALASIEPAQIIELTGTLRGSAESVIALYAGNGANLEYLSATLFEAGPERRTVGSVFPPFIASALGRHQSRADIVIAERPPVWALLGGEIGEIQMPAWLRQELPLDNGTSSRWALGRHLEREVDRQIRRHDYRLEVSGPDAVKREFFESFYLPYIQSRHGSGAITVDREKFSAVASTATLAQLFAGDTWIAGMLLQWRGETLKFGWFGSNETPPRKGASEVLDVLCIRMAAERGVRRINFGNSRPSLIDGVVRYKRKFGAGFVIPRYPQTRIDLTIRTDRPVLRAWLSGQQFRCSIGKSLRIANYSAEAPPRLEFRPIGETSAVAGP